MFNSLVITVSGVKYVYECHSHTEAMHILAGQASISQEIDSFELV